MNSRSGIVLFFLFLFLAVIILLQILSMTQSDRLYERINRLDDSLKNSSVSSSPNMAPKNPSSELSQKSPGDEGDWLVFRIGAEPATINPITSKDLYATWITNGSIFETLLEYDIDKVELKPLLAESYHVSDDGMEMTFRLKSDVCFSDGTPITAEDILFTYQTILNPKIDASQLANYYQDIKDVIKINDREVKFVMVRPYFKALEIAGLMEVLPKHIYQFTDPEEFNRHRSDPVGSGPYLFEKWQVGREIVLRKNERYWGEKPKIKKIVYRFVTNDVAALQSLQSHEIDLMQPDAEQFAELSGNQEFNQQFYSLKYWTPADGYRFIAWNQDKPFFADRRVRLAMTHLVNRELIISSLLKGLGEVVSGPFYFQGPQNNPDIKPWPYDPAKAVELLDEAGWKDTNGDGIRDKDGIPFRFKFMIVSQAAFHERLAKLLKDQAAKVGIDLIPDPYEWSVFQERLNTRAFDAVTLAWSSAILQDPYQIWHSSQIENRGSNFIGFKNPESDSLIEEARKTMDPEKRTAMYHRFHQILHEEQPYTFLLTRPSMRFLDKRFQNVKIHNLGIDMEEWFVPRELQKYK